MSDLEKQLVRFGPFSADLSTRELWNSGVRVKLGGQPFEILITLLEHPGQLVTRDELRKRIWSEDTYVDFNHGLNAAVNKLREALNDSADEPRYIETLPRRGYRFIAKIGDSEPIAIPLVTPLPVSPAPSLPQPGNALWKGSLLDEAEWENTVPIKRHTLWQLSAAATAFVVLGLVGFWMATQSNKPSQAEAELRLKQLAEAHAPPIPLHPETAKQNLKFPENRAAQVGQKPKLPQSEPRPEALEASRKSEAQRDDVLLRFPRSEALPSFFRVPSSPSDGPAILRLDLSEGSRFRFGSLVPIIGGRDAIAGPQPSPGGKKLVFMAGRNDAMDIWVCNPDGSSPKRLTDTGKAGTPRWSPDSRWIAFDSDGRFGHSGIYVVSAEGGPARPLVQDGANNSVPSWSRDGKWIYFASNRDQFWESEQLWKVPAEGGKPVQITRQGGFSAYESPDRQTIYYAKHREPNPEIWQVPLNGGPESRVSLLRPSTWASWAVTNKGILFLSECNEQVSELQYFDFATRSVRSLAILGRASFWLSASFDGKSIWYSELTDEQARGVFKASLN